MMDLPRITSREEWLEARERLLAKEKEATRGSEHLVSTAMFLDMTPLGRQEG
jgi:predicted dithiol-disulfide oxidoreductase (DUF899 family)